MTACAPAGFSPYGPACGHYGEVVDEGTAPAVGLLQQAGRAVGRAVRRPVVGAGRRIRRATDAQGAGESGLGRLMELHMVNAAGDMMITIALASTVFFSVPTDEARGRVALYLAITMAPFALLAPVVGPLLDRIPHGRRAAMAGTMLARVLLALVLSGAVQTGDLSLYPAALGVLVCSKSYGVVRSAVVPRLLPRRISLVKANSRVTLAGLLATGIAAPVGGLLHFIGPGFPLYGAMVIFGFGVFLAFRMPPAVDSARGEGKAQLASGEEGRLRTPQKPGLRSVGPSVLYALQANSSLRVLSGLMTLFLAFLLRDNPPGGLRPELTLGMAAVAAGTGNALGSVIGSWLRSRGPEKLIAVLLSLALTTTVLAAVFYSLPLLICVAAMAGFAQSLAKLSLDALIQRDVPEFVRTSAFARSETVIQLSWVLGGAIGILLPLNGVGGMAAGAAVVAVGLAATVRGLLTAGRHGTPHPRVA